MDVESFSAGLDPQFAAAQKKLEEKLEEPGLLDRMALQARLIFGGQSKAEPEHDDRTDGSITDGEPGSDTPPQPAAAAPAPVDPGPLAIDDMPDLVARSTSRRVSN